MLVRAVGDGEARTVSRVIDRGKQSSCWATEVQQEEQGVPVDESEARACGRKPREARFNLDEKAGRFASFVTLKSSRSRWCAELDKK